MTVWQHIRTGQTKAQSTSPGKDWVRTPKPRETTSRYEPTRDSSMDLALGIALGSTFYDSSPSYSDSSSSSSDFSSGGGDYGGGGSSGDW
jgi:uncharacterized membrane protein YgcG